MIDEPALAQHAAAAVRGHRGPGLGIGSLDARPAAEPGGRAVRKSEVSGIRAKLEQIIIPSIEFEDATLQAEVAASEANG